MSPRFLASSSVPLVAIAFVLLGPAWAASQSRAAKTSSPPGTAWGDPDLQGTWSNATITPLQRPVELAGREVLTDQEIADLERRTAQSRTDRPPRAGDTGTYNEFWFDRGTKVIPTRRTSLVVDPPDGRLPPLTPEGAKQQAAIAEHLRLHPSDGPEDRDTWDRCLTRGLPMLPGPYNNNLQILQTRDYVVILMEMIHDTRIIPLDGRPHVGPAIRQWLGDSRGRWEGKTLVVETTNFSEKTNGMLGGGGAAFLGLGETMHLVERFTRVDADTVLYEATISDPTYTRPWTAAVPMTRSDGQIFEYACHEGNYAMTGMLGGARNLERAAPAGTASRPR